MTELIFSSFSVSCYCCLGYAAYLTLDLTLLIEGQELDELPEVVLGGCRLRQLDLTKPEMRQPPQKQVKFQ